MQAIKICALVLLISIFNNTNVYAKLDKELYESKKCSNVFSHFEQKYKLPPNILHPISLQETAKKHSKHEIFIVWPWTVMNNQEGKAYHFKTQQEAVRYVRGQFIVGNNNLDVGCMQINLKHHPDAFLSLNHAFSPRRNVNYGAYFLSENLKKLGSIDKAIGRYHSATESLAKKYHSNVIKIKQNMSEYHDKLRYIATISNHNNNNKYANKYANLYTKDTSKFHNTNLEGDSVYLPESKERPKLVKIKSRNGRIAGDNWYRRKVN